MLSNKASNNKPVLRIYAPFLLGFFLLFVLITAFYLVPKVNQAFDTKHSQQASRQMVVESELLLRFVESLRSSLEDVASFPVLVNAAMLASADNQDLLDLVDNVSIGGNKSRLVIQDIAGDIVMQTSNVLKGDYSAEGKWFEPVLNGEIPYYFHLIGQQAQEFSFSISVPIKYGDNIEGILHAEFTKPLSQVFSHGSLQDDVAFRLLQGTTIVQTDSQHILLPREYSLVQNDLDLVFIYIVDHSPLREEEYKLRSTVLGVLLLGLIASFIFFVVLVYHFQTSHEESTGKSRHSYFSLSYIIPYVLAAIGVAVSVTAYLVVENLQQEQQRSRLQTEAQDQLQLARQGIRSSLMILDSSKGFYNASKHVEREEFTRFARSIMASNVEVQALEWIPKVIGAASQSSDVGAKSERGNYESLARRDGLKHFTFTERGGDDEIISAHNRSVHYPVFYVEPLQGNEASLGLDLASNPLRLTVLKQAQDSGGFVATGPVALIKEGLQQVGVLVFNPVYSGAVSYPSLVQRRENLQGFLALTLGVKDLIQHALGDAADQHYIKIVDITRIDDPITMLNTLPESHTEPLSIVAKEVMGIAGRSWEITLSPRLNKAGVNSSWVSLAMLAGGLLLTVLISFILVQLTRRRQLVEKLVEQRTAELQENKNFQELILSSIPDLIFVKDKDFRFVNANPAFLDLYPESMRDKVIGNTTFESYDPNQVEGFLRFDREAFASGKSETYEKVTFPNGEAHTLFTKKVRFTNSLGESFILGIGRDVTEREDLVRQLKRSNEELDEFAYIASHDLKEPLRGIYLHASMFLRNMEGALDEDGERRLNRVMDLTKYMETLVSDLLYFSRMGRTDIAMQATDMDALVREVIASIPMIEEEGVDVLIPNALPVVMCDKVRIGEVLRNLIVNGLKYHDGEQKSIEIGAIEQKIEGVKSPVFYVKDNGIGIDEEFHEEIFRIFKRLHKKSAYGGGTGSGLTFVKKIIDRHGGSVWVQSQKGQGSTFFFTLPPNNQNGRSGEST